MYNRINQVLEQYPFVVSQTKKGRDALICETDQGLKILKEYRGSEGRADFLYRILLFLKENGQKRVDCIQKTREGRTIALDGDETVYLMRDWYEGRECDTKNREDVLKAVRQLAYLHNIFRSYQEEIPDFLKVDGERLILEYGKHLRELKKVKNYMAGKKKKNEFEMKFLKSCDCFLERAAEVTALQEKGRRDTGGGKELRGICHGEFNQHNVIFSREGISILNFERAAYDEQMSDLSHFMRKIMEKHNWSMTLGMDMLEAYGQIRQLGREELLQLYVRLAYPEKFWKISNHYYNTGKAWLCVRDLEKLARVVEQEEAKEHFLKAIFGNQLF